MDAGVGEISQGRRKKIHYGVPAGFLPKNYCESGCGSRFFRLNFGRFRCPVEKRLGFRSLSLRARTIGAVMLRLTIQLKITLYG
jgi:hypothetical protein